MLLKTNEVEKSERSNFKSFRRHSASPIRLSREIPAIKISGGWFFRDTNAANGLKPSQTSCAAIRQAAT